MNANLAAILYLASGVLFILALRGLSSPETSRRGNTMGMVGMAIATLTTLSTLYFQGALDGVTLGLIAGGVAIGGGVGAVIARRVAMTSMPQLVAAFHSLVGLAACLVAVAAILAGVSGALFTLHVGDQLGGGLGGGVGAGLGHVDPVGLQDAGDGRVVEVPLRQQGLMHLPVFALPLRRDGGAGGALRNW